MTVPTDPPLPISQTVLDRLGDGSALADATAALTAALDRYQPAGELDTVESLLAAFMPMCQDPHPTHRLLAGMICLSLLTAGGVHRLCAVLGRDPHDLVQAWASIDNDEGDPS